MLRLGGLVGAALLALTVACAPAEYSQVAGPATGVVRPSSPAVDPTTTTVDSSTSTVAGPDAADETTTQPRRRSFTMAFTGDLLLHSRVNAAAAANAADDDYREYDYESLLAPIADLIAEVDWAVCHLEVSLSADNTRLRSFPVFRAPGDIAHDVRRVGYDSCSTASNHVLDHGSRGVAETLGVLDAADLGHTGSARTPEERFDSIWIEAGDVTVAHLSYTYGFNGFAVPSDMPWLSNRIDEQVILADAARARAAGAEYLLLSLHWGDQYRHAPNRSQRDLGSHLLASPDIDLIIGHHAHVVQPIDRIDGEWLVYGLGNLLSASPQPSRRDELMVRITVTEQPDRTFSTELQAIPLHLDRMTLTVHPSNPALGRTGDDPALEAELDASWHRVSAVLDEGSGRAELTLG